MKFLMLRNRVIVSTLGHAIEFVKNVPTFVPPEMYTEVMAAGGVPEEEIPEDQLPVKSNEPVSVEDRTAALFAAFETIVHRGKREDFTAAGVPTNKALDTELGWVPPAKERDVIWVQFKTKGE